MNHDAFWWRNVQQGETWMFFSIHHCSWTGRCYTLYNARELMGMGVRPTGVRIRFKHPLDLKINDVILRDGDKYEMSCCAVRGIR